MSERVIKFATLYENDYTLRECQAALDCVSHDRTIPCETGHTSPHDHRIQSANKLSNQATQTNWRTPYYGNFIFSHYSWEQHNLSMTWSLYTVLHWPMTKCISSDKHHWIGQTQCSQSNSMSYIMVRQWIIVTDDNHKEVAYRDIFKDQNYGTVYTIYIRYVGYCRKQGFENKYGSYNLGEILE